MNIIKKYGRSTVVNIIAIFVMLMAVALYIFDTYRASQELLNLIFVIPLASIIVILFLALAVQEIRGKDEESTNDEQVPSIKDEKKSYQAIAVFIVYVLSLNWLGFDVGTSLFTGVFLWLQGERRPAYLIVFAIAVGFGLAAFFSLMLPYPMPLLVL